MKILIKIILLVIINVCSYSKEVCINEICISGTDESHTKKYEFTKITIMNKKYVIKHENLWMNTFKEYNILLYLEKKIQFLLLYEGHPYVGIIFELHKKNGKYRMSNLYEIDISKNIAHICKYNIKSEKEMIDFTFNNRKKNFIDKGCSDGENFRFKRPLEEVALILRNR